MKILLLNDGKIGHFNQAKALAQDFDYKILNIRAKKSKSILRSIFRFYIFKSLKLIELFYEIDSKIEPFDVIISSGKDSEYLNIWLKNYFKAKSIYLGKPRGVNPKYFDFIFTTLDLNLPNQIVLDAIPSIHTKNQNELNLDKNQTYYTFLFGGDSSDYRYSSDDILNLSNLLNRISQRDNIKWLITTSRRSSFEDILEQNVENLDYFLNYKKETKNLIGEFFENSQKIFVSEDSSSMISDAINSQKPTFSLYPKEFNLSGDFKKILKKLIDKKLLQRISIYEDNLEFLDNKFNKIEKFDIKKFFRDEIERDSISK